MKEQLRLVGPKTDVGQFALAMKQRAEDQYALFGGRFDSYEDAEEALKRLPVAGMAMIIQICGQFKAHSHYVRQG